MLAEIRRIERKSQVPLCLSAGRGTHKIPAAPLEHREVHHLSDGDNPAYPARHQILRYLVMDLPMDVCMGSGGA